MAIIGIDLGTTFSVVAYIDKAGQATAVENKEGHLITPSVVFIQDEDDISVGASALNSSTLFPEQTVEFVKNDIGNEVTYKIKEKIYTPEHISALVLKKLMQDAEEVLDDKITGAVITVPAIFGESQRFATKKAAELAGLNVIAILNEPEAAAMCYGVNKLESNDRKKRILVYDLGGGTFDITVIEVAPESIKVLLTDGDRRLGGKDWDDAILNYVAEKFLQQFDSDPRENSEARQKLRIAAEDAKRNLSKNLKTQINFSYKNNDYRIELTRQLFEELTADLLKRTEITTKHTVDTLINNQIINNWTDIDQVLLVGGATLMPQVANMISSLTGKNPISYKPHLSVALGAALYGVSKILSYNSVQLYDQHKINPYDYVSLPRLEMTSISSFAIGVRVVDSKNGKTFTPNISITDDDLYNLVIIERNSTLPVKSSTTLSTLYENQSSVKLVILEGESRDHRQCIKLGEGIISDLPPLPKGTSVEVEVELTNEGLISISAVIPKAPQSSISWTIKREIGTNINFDDVQSKISKVNII